MNQYKLLVLPGDGIGPEIIDEGLALLKQIEIIEIVKLLLLCYLVTI